MLRRIFTIIPLVLLAGAALLLFFINLIGGTNSGVMSDFYWSEVNSQDLGTNWDKTRWTLYSICGVQNGDNYDCTSAKPAYPYSPADNFDSTRNVPEEFINRRDLYYYLSRFAYAFFLIGIVGAVLALIPTFLSCFLAGRITGFLSCFASGISLLFTAAGAAFITAVHVMGRNHFNDAGFDSHVSAKAFGILWGAVACLLISFVWMCVVANKAVYKKFSKNHEQHEESYEKPVSTDSSSFQHDQPVLAEEPQQTRGGFFRRN